MAGKFLFRARVHDASMRIFRDDLPAVACTCPDKPESKEEAIDSKELMIDDAEFNLEAAAAAAAARREQLNPGVASNELFARQSDRLWGRRSLDAISKLSPIQQFVAASDAHWAPKKAPAQSIETGRNLSANELFAQRAAQRWGAR